MSVLGVWMWPDLSLPAGRTVDLLARAGFTDLFLLTKGLAGTTAYPSRLAPPAREGDLLGELTDCAHRRGLRVHAWLTSAADEHYKALHPESGRCHYTRGRDKGLISLTDEGYLAYMQAVVREICRYDIDGLHLDYIRYNHLMYGWSEEDRSRYAAAGADPARLRQLMDRTFLQDGEGGGPDIFDAFRAGDADARALAAVRRRDVQAFARSLFSVARAEKGGLLLSAALMPEGAYADTAFADLHYGQHYADFAGLIDLALPMAYSRAYEKGPAWVREVAEGTLARGLRTVAGLHAYEGGTGETLAEDLAALRGTAADGACLFRAGTFALACADGPDLLLTNPLDRPITALLADGRPVPLSAPLSPGETRRLRLPCEGARLRVFTGPEEVCVYRAGPAAG